MHFGDDGLLYKDPGEDFYEITHALDPSWKTRPVIKPEGAIIHYAVTHNLAATIAAQRASGYFAPISLDGFKEGERSRFQLTQLLPWNRRGSHAGVSSWEGRTSLNGWAGGLEIANPGPLVERDGKLFTVYGKEWPRDQAIQAKHKNGRCPYKWWAKFTSEEYIITAQVMLAAKEKGWLRFIAGHDDVAPERKIDPGPAFDMNWLQSIVFPDVT